MSSPCAFIDKDGTIVDDSGYPPKIPADVLLEKYILEGLGYLQSKGYKMIIVSNQPWISKGEKSEKEIEDTFKSVVAKLAKLSIKIDDYFYCSHTAEDNCNCRKPKTGMIDKAVKKHKIDLKKSFMVGDSDNDILLAKNAKIKGILVLTGHGKETAKEMKVNHIIKNLNEISKVII